MIVLKLKAKNQYHTQIDWILIPFPKNLFVLHSLPTWPGLDLTWEGSHNEAFNLDQVGLWACLRGFYLHYINWNGKTCSPCLCWWHCCLGRGSGAIWEETAGVAKHICICCFLLRTEDVAWLSVFISYHLDFPEMMDCTLKLWASINHFPRSYFFFRELYYSNRKGMVISLTL